MAMNRQDYITEGTVMFENGMNRPVGTSWQVKAMQVGYDVAACNDHDRKLEEEAREGAEKANSRPVEAGQKESEGEGSPTAAEALAMAMAEVPKTQSTVIEQFNKLCDIEAGLSGFVGMDFANGPDRTSIHPAFHHIDNLKLQFSFEVNPVRKERLRLKIYKLSYKWNRRGVVL